MPSSRAVDQATARANRRLEVLLPLKVRILSFPPDGLVLFAFLVECHLLLS